VKRPGICRDAREPPQRVAAGALGAIPAAPFTIMGLPSGVRSLFRLATGEQDNPLSDGPIMAASRKALETSGDIQDWVSNKVGLPPADTAGEVAPEIMGGLLTGAGLAKIPGVIGKTVGKMTPTTAKGVGITTGALTGADSAIKAYVDQEYGTPKVEEKPAEVAADPFDVPTSPSQAQTVPTSQVQHTQPTQSIGTAASSDPFDIPQVAETSDPFDIAPVAAQQEQSLPAKMLDEMIQFAQEQYKPIIAGTLAVGGGLYIKRAASARRLAQQSGELVGTTETERALSRTQRLNSSLLDESAALKDTFKGTEPERADFSATVATSGNPVAVNHKITAALHDGDLPGLGIKYDFTPKQWFDGRAMLKDDAKVLNDALIARSELVSRRVIKDYSPSFKKSEPELQAMVDAGLTNPAVAKMMDHYDGIMSRSLDYLANRGIISADKASGLKTDFPHYVPFMVGEKQSFFQRLADSTMSYQDRKSFNELTNILTREGGAGKVVDPGTAMEHYISHMNRLGEINKVRSVYVDAAIKGGSKFIKEAGKEGDNTITIFKDGLRKAYTVDDPDLRSALEMSPKVVAPMANAARRTFQTMTTGAGALWYTVKALSYDALMASSTAPKGFGLFRGEPVSALALAGSGLGRAIYGHLMRAARDGFQKTLLSDELGRPSILAQTLPRAMVERLADITATAYSNSTMSLFERSGAGGAGRFTEHLNYRNFQTQMERISPDVAASPLGMRAWNFYRAAMDSAQNAVRLEYLARHGRSATTAEALAAIAKETRELTGDFARRGGSRPAAGYAQTVPYGNVSVQSLARWGKALHDNPVGTTFGILNTVALPSLAAQVFGSQDVAWQEYLKSLPMDDRNSNLFFYIPGVAPENMPRFQLPGELQPIKAAADALFSSLFNGDPSMQAALEDLLEGRGVANIQAGFVRAVPPMLPIGMQQAGALAGYDVRQDGFPSVSPVDRQVQGQPTSTTNVQLPFDAGTGAELIQSNYVRNLVSHVFGSLGQLIMGTLGAAEQGYRGSGGDKWTALSEGLEQANLDVIKKIPAFAPLWGQDTAPGMRTYEHVHTGDKLRALGEIEKLVQTASKEPAKQALSPTSLQLGTMLSSYSKQYAPLLDQRRDILKRLDASKSNVAIGPTMRMQDRSSLMKELQQVEGIIGESIRGLEADVSERISRKFRVEDFRPDF